MRSVLRHRLGLVAALALALAGCGDDDHAAADAGAVDGGFDSGLPEDAATEDVPPRPPDVCDELGLARVAMEEGTGASWEEIAGDFTVETLDGAFTLSEAWTGCESYVFVLYADTPYGNELWSTLPDPLLRRSGRNVHYFFASYETDPDAARARVAEVQTKFEDAYAFLGFDEAEAAFWRARVHFVTTPIGMTDGSVGDLVRATPYVLHALAIGRNQRFDPVGSLYEVTGGGFTARFGMAAFASRWLDYRAELEARLAAESGTTEVVIADEEGVTARVLDRRATLPDAATLATFDRLEVDVTITCFADPGNCSEWDRIAYVHVCLDDACTDRRELARWITPYSRPGLQRWVIDASPLLPLIASGGEKLFRVETGPEWEEPTSYGVRVALRLSSRGGADRPVAAALAFRGGEFDATYADAHPPFHFTPPAGTSRVELALIVSGHGQTTGDGCAEWCNHEHTFTVNGAASHRVDFPGDAGRAYGCAERAGEGVIPGQWGNWAPSRAGWCPGLPVPLRRLDITSDVTIGADNELAYAGTFAGGTPRGGTIDLSAYVVYFE